MNTLLFAELLGQRITTNLPHVTADNVTLQLILNTIYSLAGAAAVIMVIYGGIRYSLAGGDPGGVTKAKNTILYAIVGLIIVVIAFAITNFILGKINVSSWSALRDSVINTLIYIAGTISVIMMIYGGFRYTTSAGNAAGVKRAKDTILGAAIGLIIAILAFAIVNFVIGKI